MFGLPTHTLHTTYLCACDRGCKISLARCGGVTHWALTPDDDDTVMTVSWGQNAANGKVSHSFLDSHSLI